MTDTQFKMKYISYCFAKVIRILTVPPFLAAVLVLVLFFTKGAFRGFGLPVSLFSLCVLPLASYALWYAVPALKRGGRASQRKVAVICSVLGYLLNTAYVLFTGAAGCERLAVFTYLFSGIITAVLSFVFRVKSSGHACGVSGPAFLLTIAVHPAFVLMDLLLIPVFRSSLMLKRHSLAELITGTAVPVLVQLVLLLTGICTLT